MPEWLDSDCRSRDNGTSKPVMLLERGRDTVTGSTLQSLPSTADLCLLADVDICRRAHQCCFPHLAPSHLPIRCPETQRNGSDL